MLGVFDRRRTAAVHGDLGGWQGWTWDGIVCVGVAAAGEECLDV